MMSSNDLSERTALKARLANVGASAVSAHICNAHGVGGVGARRRTATPSSSSEASYSMIRRLSLHLGDST